ncbi:PREDICTED: uncharacterized protein LOC104806035 [Tarenaya hassleriana]|uniref:uncharacterized protein LOC104806035 n=1 Tax=Tarenaya hassleriana TaxID=28532 RepID=UPI00053C6DA5|nr:PREDICTED: uncharacterized protein LOC104806035 [Tarenaya hassleriana]
MTRIFCWNVRGLNDSAKQRNVKNWIDEQKPIIGCLIETRVRSEAVAVSISQRLFPGWAFTHNYHSADLGRIWVTWDPSISVVVYSASEQCITCGVFIPVSGVYATISFIYAKNTPGERRSLWTEISGLATNGLIMSRPWLLAGDFNQILRPQEHASPTVPFNPTSGMFDLQDCIFSNGLFDLTTRGHFFTWINNNSDNPIARKLDRAIVNEKWLLAFPESLARFDAPLPSDHCPCLVELFPTTTRRLTSFKFFKHLLKHDDFHLLVSQTWAQDCPRSTAMYRLSYKLKSLKPVLRGLNKRAFSSIQTRVKAAMEALKEAQSRLLDNPTIEAARLESDLRSSWSILSAAEETFLRQKSRIR